MDPHKIGSPWMAVQRWIKRYRLTRALWRGLLYVLEYISLRLQSLWLYLCPRNKYIQAVNDYVKRNIAKHQSTLSFLKALAINPRATGAVLPSSKRLAREMASYIDFSGNGLVVELGAGTGVITAAILEAGVDPKRLVAIEYAPHLAKQLQIRFPDIEVIEGNAANLAAFVKNKTQSVDAVVSGLPLRSLPDVVAQAILDQIPQVLSKTGRYIQFTYDIRSDANYYPEHYELGESTIIWRNIPPARVDVFTFK